MSTVEEDTQTLDVDKLSAWLDGQGLGVGAPLEHRFVSGGAQNEIYEIRRGDVHGALRMPPTSAPAQRDEGIVREWRIIEALDGTEVPHTPAIALCEDSSVLGRPFYLMGFVDGWSPMNMTDRKWPEPFEGTVPSVQADYPWPGSPASAAANAGVPVETVQPDAELVAQA